MSLTKCFLELWAESRTRFSIHLTGIEEADLKLKFPDSVNSVGFLIRHISDVELLFAKNVFGQADVKVSAKTLIAKTDTGEWNNLLELMDYQNYAYCKLKESIISKADDEWGNMITTKEFGTRTLSEALGRIISHTAWHAGQMALILKYLKS